MHTRERRRIQGAILGLNGALMVKAGDNSLAKPPASGPSGSSPTASVLTDWKQIAHYLGKGVRTVQRWERELGLPVQRTQDHHPKSTVMAFAAEIDGWVKTLKFHGRRLISVDSEGFAMLLRSLEELRAENQALRRELEVDWVKGKG
jgi:hypothetical protein